MKTKIKNNKKWFQVFSTLKRDILDNGYSKGNILATKQELCKRFGVSDIVIRRALDELKREGLIINKPGVGIIINKSTKITSIKVFVGNRWDKHIQSSPFIFLKIISGIEEEARNKGLKVEYINNRMFKELSDEVILSFYELYRNDLLPLSPNNTYIILHSPRRIPPYHTVRHGLFEGAYIATKYLIGQGHKRIGFLGLLKYDWYLARLQGYLEALKEFNLGTCIDYIKETEGDNKEADWKAIESLMKLKNPPTAVFCANDTRALNIIEYCNEKGIRIPEDLAICGFDNTPESGVSNPKLTTIDTKLDELGREGVRLAVRILEEELKETQDVVIQPELIIREST